MWIMFFMVYVGCDGMNVSAREKIRILPDACATKISGT
jgi:hypothetical protein